MSQSTTSTPRQRLRRRVWGAVGAAAVAALAVLLIVLIVRTFTLVDAVREAQITNTGTLDYSKKNLDAITKLAKNIDSCTNPKGACSRRNQEQTAKAIGSIKSDTRDVVVATVVCQRQGNSEFDAITMCVDRALAQRAHTPKP